MYSCPKFETGQVLSHKPQEIRAHVITRLNGPIKLGADLWVRMVHICICGPELRHGSDSVRGARNGRPCVTRNRLNNNVDDTAE